MIDTICARSLCTGCEACSNICPQSAIMVSEDSKGFLYPKVDKFLCVDCGLCKKACPANNSIIKRQYLNCYASYSLDSEIRRRSSSGGIFTELSRFIISRNGIVVGAAFDIRKSRLKHIVIDRIDDLGGLQGAKYIQSKIGNIYKDIKSLLMANRLVLFSGTPCQITGLKSYLGKEYRSLYTVDIFCHGVPSSLVFRKYLEEMHYIKGSGVHFRNKIFGWNNYNLSFQTSNGIVKSLNDTDTYIRGFISNLYLRESCFKCKYNTVDNRNADMSIGDFWGVEQFYPDLSDNKGISAAIVYSKKGKELLAAIASKAYLKKVKIEEIIAGNPVLMRPVDKHPNMDKFFAMIEKHGVIEATENALNMNKRVAILNHSFSHDNFGALMVAYSMERILWQLGYHPETIQIQTGARTVLDDFKDKFLHFTEPYKLDDNLSDLNGRFKTFIVGSDQVWRNWWHNDKIMSNFFLSFADKTKNLIAYGVSFGIDRFEGSKKLKSCIKNVLKAYNAISVREEEGIKILEDEFSAEAKLVIDPTLLIDVRDYYKIIESEDLPNVNQKYLAYMIFPGEDFDTKKTKDIILNIAATLNLKTVFSISKGYTVGRWLKTLKDADFIVTDSFHGMIFSIIFKKQFICLINKLGGATRFMHIAERLGLRERIFYSTNDINIEKLIRDKIDYKSVGEKLSILRNYSLDFLQKALAINVIDNGLRKFSIVAFLRDIIIRSSVRNNKNKVYLFYFIPLLKLKKSSKNIKIYLFHFLPIFWTKNK